VGHEDGTETLYAHNSTNIVTPGQRVTPDEVIAKSGSSGRSTGPHLHFEVRRDGRAIDPMPFLH
jgi:murein DD-endopeptidase MepM/ murein hydrolase activator NlpD